jgi:peroxiredoxin
VLVVFYSQENETQAKNELLDLKKKYTNFEKEGIEVVAISSNKGAK